MKGEDVLLVGRKRGDGEGAAFESDAWDPSLLFPLILPPPDQVKEGIEGWRENVQAI